jgi:arginine decarboxylase
MPGHKRRLMPEEDLPYAWDFTEVSGTDDLHHAEGILHEAMDRTARCFGADRTWYLVNGSTCGNLAGIYAMTSFGGEVIAARNCHRSIFHILELRGLHVHWLMPPIDKEYGIYGSIDVHTVGDMLKRYPHVKAVILTSPTYEGVVSDIHSIAELCHAHGVPLFVDEAHGAHFGLFPKAGFPDSAIHAGADVVVQSLHKTLPSLTQTALLHLRRGLVSEARIEQGLGIFETSSPSYPLMVSIDACTEYLLTEGEPSFLRWKEALQKFRDRISGLRYYHVLCYGEDSARSHGFYAFDPSKLLVNAKRAGLTGAMLQDRLLRDYHFELEMSMGSNALAMTGPGEDEQQLLRFADALRELDREAAAAESAKHNISCNAAGDFIYHHKESAGLDRNEMSFTTGGSHMIRVKENVEGTCIDVDKYISDLDAEQDITEDSLLKEAMQTAPFACMAISEAVEQPSEIVDIQESSGRISAEYVYCYPPGIPLVIPGEMISDPELKALSGLRKAGYELRFTRSGEQQDQILVVKETVRARE